MINYICCIYYNVQTEDDQKLKVEDNNDDEHTDSIFNKEDPMNNDEIDQEKPVNVEGVKISNESKTNLRNYLFFLLKRKFVTDLIYLRIIIFRI